MKRWRAKQKHRAKKRRLYKDRCRTLRDISPEAWTEAFDEVQELVDLSIQNEDRGHV